MNDYYLNLTKWFEDLAKYAPCLKNTSTATLVKIR